MAVEDNLFPPEVYGATMTFDAEANGLLDDKLEFKGGITIRHPAATRIWMICHKDQDTGKCYDFIDDEMLKIFKRDISRHNRAHDRGDTKVYPLSLLPKFWDASKLQIGHHSQKFDFPLVEKLLGYHMPREKRWDTLIQSQTQFCDREYVMGSTSGPHSVESYALRFNKGRKVEHEDWMNFSIDMYKRCWRDVEIQCDIYTFLQDEREVDRVECNINWDAALRTEHMAAFWISYSEKWGFPCNIEHATNLVNTLDKSLEDIEDELLPTMPFRINFDNCGTKINWDTYVEVMLKNSGLTQLPLGWCWPEDSGNKPQPVWNPFNKDGSVSQAVKDFWVGKEAQDAIPAEPAIEAQPAVLDENGKAVVKAVRARKARPAVEAKERKPSAYEDDAALMYPPIIRMTHEDVGGPFTRIRWVNYNIGSNSQVIEYLQRYTTWEPVEFTEKGNPKLTEDSFESIDGDGVGLLLKTYLIDKSRRTNIKNFKDGSKGWLNLLRADGRITPVNHTMGTPTARSRHSGLVNVPSGGARWGNEMRECWTAYEGGLMIGSDASGLEMRMLAHEMGDEECTNEIVDGDIHTVIWNLIPDLVLDRKSTKSVEYALIYGASDEKLGSLANVVGCKEEFASQDKLFSRGWVVEGGMWRHKNWSPKKESVPYKSAQDIVCGGIIRMRIMKGLKPLGDCIERITKQAEKGYLVGIDGRKLTVRSSHSALNLKLQSSGAILMKSALVNLMERMEREGLVVIGENYKPCTFVELFTFYHDEYQLGIPASSVEAAETFCTDVRGLDTSDKGIKKEIEERLAKMVSRFQKRQAKSGIRWSEPVIDVKAGTAEVKYSKVGQYCVESFEHIGKYFKMDCPITGNYQVGKSWRDTH